MWLECGEFKVLFQLMLFQLKFVKGTLFFPPGGFFNEVTQIKKREV